MGYTTGDCVIFNVKGNTFTGTIMDVIYNPVYNNYDYYLETTNGTRFVIKETDILDYFANRQHLILADEIKYKGMQNAFNDANSRWHIKFPKGIKEIIIESEKGDYILSFDEILDIIKKYAKEEKDNG